MGGCCCCCASKRVELNSSPPFYHNQCKPWLLNFWEKDIPVVCPRENFTWRRICRSFGVSEEREPLSSQNARASTLSTGFLVDTNLDTSIPDTYRPPPTPLPYDTYVAPPRTPNREVNSNKNDPAIQTTNNASVEETNSDRIAEGNTKEVEEDKVLTTIELIAAKEVGDELEKSGEIKNESEPVLSSLQEEDCPICLEEYDVENPRIQTKCDHHFHLSCILEWMERSSTCPVCDQEMVFSMSIDG